MFSTIILAICHYESQDLKRLLVLEINLTQTDTSSRLIIKGKPL